MLDRIKAFLNLEKPSQSNCKARLIAFYLPQFHPIPENDEWWGKGFTEWFNVVKAGPLFPTHPQPHLPADLGFYDLRVPETRIAQADLAQTYGIEGFCYWHYWFAGRRVLERPFNEVLRSGEPDFPFCLGWANDSWTGIWHGCADKMLIEQTYPGAQDEESHFYALLEAFSDKRYMTVDGKPIFFIYKPYELPEPKRFFDHWRALAAKNGLKGIYFIGNARTMDWIPEMDGFDAMTLHNPGLAFHRHFNPHFDQKHKTSAQGCEKTVTGPDVFIYAEYIKYALPELRDYFDEYPCVVPNWDNTPRCGNKGNVLLGSTPELFRTHLREAIAQVSHRVSDKRIVFVKSWNEWAEGNYLEPDMELGRAYLEVCRDEVICSGTGATAAITEAIPNAEEKTVNVNWRSFEKETKKIDIARLKTKSSYSDFNIDRLSGIKQPFETQQPIILKDISTVEISGWAIDLEDKSLAGGVFAQVDNKSFIGMYGFERRDVARVKGPQYINAGFRVFLPVSEIGKGKHILTIRVISKDLKSYYSTSERQLTFTLE